MAKLYRPHMPDKVKLQVVLRQEGKDPSGEKLGNLSDIEFDHCPPLALREYDEATRTYTPDANDPEYIVARIKQLHRAKTSHPRGPHTSLGGDQHLIAKTRNGRDTKFRVVKPDLAPPASKAEPRPAPARCRGCGHDPELCICPPREQRSSFRQARRA